MGRWQPIKRLDRLLLAALVVDIIVVGGLLLRFARQILVGRLSVCSCCDCRCFGKNSKG